MEIKFRNKTVRDKKVNDTCAWHMIEPKHYRLWCICILVSLLVCIWDLVDAIRLPETQSVVQFVILMLIFLYCAACPWLKYLSNKRKIKKLMLDSFGTESVEMEYTFTEQGLQRFVVGKDDVIGCTYETIQAFIETQKYFIMVSDGFWIVLDKNGFLEGDAEEFRRFAHQKLLYAEFFVE